MSRLAGLTGSPGLDEARPWNHLGERNMRKEILGLAVAPRWRWPALPTPRTRSHDRRVHSGSRPRLDGGRRVPCRTRRQAADGTSIRASTSSSRPRRMPASQANAVQDLATQGIDALVILPSDPDPLVNAIKEVKAKGTFVAIVDRAPSRQRQFRARPLRRRQQPGSRRSRRQVHQGQRRRTHRSSSSAACRSRSTSSARTASTRASQAPTSRFSTASSATGTATMPSRSCRTT